MIASLLKNRVELKWRWIWGVILIPSLIMLPILLWPHYGLFSDATQVIAFPERVLANLPESLSLLLPLEDGRWNPLFHGLTILIYAIAPGSPRALYVAQWGMLTTTCLAITWILTKLTYSRWLAIIGVVLFCSSSSILENFFTLDKVEPRLTVFSSLIVASLVAHSLSDRNGWCGQHWWRFAVIQASFGILVMFSKETGAYLAAGIAGTWLASLLNPQWGGQTRTLFRNAMVINTAVVVFFIALFKFFSSGLGELINGRMSYRYVTYNLTPLLVLQNISYYLITSPELALGLLCSAYWCLRVFFRRLPGPQDSIQVILVFLSLCTISYFAGICLWRWPLDYYLLPAHCMTSLLLPLTFWGLAKRIQYRGQYMRKVAWVAVILWCCFSVFRLFLGYAIFAQDAVKDDLAQYLSRPELFGKRIVLPLSHPDSSEIGERLEFFINRSRHNAHPVDLFNFWETPFLNRQKLDRFKSSVAIAPDEQLLAQLAKHPDRYVVWQFGTNENVYFDIMQGFRAHSDDGVSWNPQMLWRPSYLRDGDLLLVPTGSKAFLCARSRGIRLYTQSAQDFIRRTPLQLTHLGGVHRGPTFATIGWDLFRVDQVEADAQAGSGYSLASLMALNNETDITEPATTTALFEKKDYPPNGVLLGYGWYDIEKQNGLLFRWMGTRSEVVLTHLPAGTCSVTADIEPLLTSDSEAFTLTLGTGSEQADYSLTARKTVTFSFRSSGDVLQVLNFSTQGGVNNTPKGDSRLLKARTFSLRLLRCVPD